LKKKKKKKKKKEKRIKKWMDGRRMEMSKVQFMNAFYLLLKMIITSEYKGN
jgi:hypothetical protein